MYVSLVLQVIVHVHIWADVCDPSHDSTYVCHLTCSMFWVYKQIKLKSDALKSCHSSHSGLDVVISGRTWVWFLCSLKTKWTDRTPKNLSPCMMAFPLTLEDFFIGVLSLLLDCWVWGRCEAALPFFPLSVVEAAVWKMHPFSGCIPRVNHFWLTFPNIFHCSNWRHVFCHKIRACHCCSPASFELLYRIMTEEGETVTAAVVWNDINTRCSVYWQQIIARIPIWKGGNGLLFPIFLSAVPT